MNTSTAANDSRWILDVTQLRPGRRAGVTIEIGAGCFVRLPELTPQEQLEQRRRERAWRARVRAGLA